jgi:hypothetical protein
MRADIVGVEKSSGEVALKLVVWRDTEQFAERHTGGILRLVRSRSLFAQY